MRALSYAQAATCETATTKHCRCRCGGRLHGARRIQPGADRAAFEALPAGDPHRVHHDGQVALDDLMFPIEPCCACAGATRPEAGCRCRCHVGPFGSER